MLLHHGRQMLVYRLPHLFDRLIFTVCFKLGATCIGVFTNGSNVGLLPDISFPRNRSAFGSLHAAVDEHDGMIP